LYLNIKEEAAKMFKERVRALGMKEGMQIACG
jgi:hypothetical protein